MADQPARSVTLQVRVTPAQIAVLEKLGERKERFYSDIRKVDGGINTSAVVRHIIDEEARAKGLT
jgi:hypothetical protein